MFLSVGVSSDEKINNRRYHFEENVKGGLRLFFLFLYIDGESGTGSKGEFRRKLKKTHVPPLNQTRHPLNTISAYVSPLWVAKTQNKVKHFPSCSDRPCWSLVHPPLHAPTFSPHTLHPTPSTLTTPHREALLPPQTMDRGKKIKQDL